MMITPRMVTLQSFYSSNISIMSYCLVILVILPALVSSDQCTCDAEEATGRDSKQALKFKLAAIVSILVSGALGVSLPLLGKKFAVLRPENDAFFLIKAFAAGVILGTGFIHILPDAFDDLTSACLKESPWRNFPFSGFIAMMSAIGTLMLDSLATGCYKRNHFKSTNRQEMDEEKENGQTGHVHVHTHATHGHAHGSAIAPAEDLKMAELIRNRIVSQVLELGIVVHSVIIGVTLGASQSLDTIKPLFAALSFHQFFEGMGLGGCISQARFESLSTLLMATFFSLTTPVGIAIGIGISSVYKESTPAALIIEGCFNSASAGILIYMALVDLLAADFMNSRMQSNVSLQLGANLSLLLGAGCMSVLAKWA